MFARMPAADQACSFHSDCCKQPVYFSKTVPVICAVSRPHAKVFLAMPQRCGYELQESKMLSLSTRHHDYGRQSRDDAQGYYSSYRGGDHSEDATGGGEAYGAGAQSGLGMFDRLHLGDDLSDVDEDDDDDDDDSCEESE